MEEEERALSETTSRVDVFGSFSATQICSLLVYLNPKNLPGIGGLIQGGVLCFLTTKLEFNFYSNFMRNDLYP